MSLLRVRPDRAARCQPARPAAGRGYPRAMPSLQRLAGATLLGAVCGVRTFTGPAALALRGRVDGTPARVGLTLAAAGEAIGDKLPLVPSRTAPPALAARV